VQTSKSAAFSLSFEIAKREIMASLEPINPESDSRIEHKTAKLNGQTYQYLYGVPKSGKWKHTVFLASTPFSSLGFTALDYLLDLDDATERRRGVLSLVVETKPFG
jgi:hypothetical protein